MDTKKRILFICTGNSCRSQMAEVLMNKLGGDHYYAFSAGSNPAGYVHPLAIETMSEMGMDISQNKSKSLNIYLHEAWDMVVTVCDDANESCPFFPGGKIREHWGFEDPAKFDGTEEEKRAFFRKIADQIEVKIKNFLASSSSN
jgi:arsenate reductase